MPDDAAPSLAPKYKASDHEDAVRARWERAGAFHPDPERVLSGERRPYCIFIPPPNVTARLHLGHALNNTLQDILARVHRMRGFEVLWMPGTDHAGIGTESIVERRIRAEEGKRRGDFTREQFVARVQAWKDEYERAITDQLKAIGCSCDWERQRFTMDELFQRAVREAFFILFRDGLIYRGKRLVNWDPVNQTALADDEVEMKDIDGFFYYLRYPLVRRVAGEDAQPVSWSELARRGYPGASQHPPEQQAWVTVATTRPETYLGDTAVAVNPKDPRAASLTGLHCELPLVGRVIPIIADDYVVMPSEPRASARGNGADHGLKPAAQTEPEDPKAKYATGFLKVTPAHDPNDEQIGRRHSLPVINVMAPDASISDKHGWSDVGDARTFLNLSREAAREKVLAEFKARGLLEKQTPYTHAVGHSYRSHVPIEPYLSDQWYCKVTDDRMRVSALRAMTPNQRSASSAFLPPLGGMGVPPVPTPSTVLTDNLTIHHRYLPQWQVGGKTYFLTFRLRSGELRDSERRQVLDACAHWHDERAVVHLITVMPDHVHLLVTPLKKPDGSWHTLPELLHSIKSFASHEIQQQRGSSGELWQQEYFDRIIRDEDEYSEKWTYMVHNPVEAGLARLPQDYPFTYSPAAHDDEPEGRWAGRASRKPGKKEKAVEGVGTGGTPIPPRGGRESRKNGSQQAAGDGSLTFFPERYARTYESWHENLRDWCISRQLWWGHQIPVWWKHMPVYDVDGELQQQLRKWSQSALIVQSIPGDTQAGGPDDARSNVTADAICIAPSPQARSIAEFIESQGWRQDPDVLDTWFSSALWPIATLGWPEPPPHMKGLLEAFNPSAVLCTARDIITLWVSRMVMFNRYFLSSSASLPPLGGMGVPPVPTPSMPFSPGRLPFRHVYINPVVQDGHGQRMSKSLGNGVDPLDIVHSHGTDAMRFVLCQITTGTQDVRMPVDIVCPHCHHAFEPAWITSPAGYKVAAPNQSCPGCKKHMVSAYGVSAGIARPSADTPQARNGSTRFDVGRNFCTKLWNATRFALMNLEGSSSSLPPLGGMGVPPVPTLSTLPDRWILSRLSRTITTIDAALADYQFSRYAEAVYDLFWRDFCDWYLEAIKPTVRSNPDQQAVLRHALDSILRLLHPIAPYITEVLYEALSTPGDAARAQPEPARLLCLARWPAPDPAHLDENAEREFARLQSLVEQVRQVRSAKSVEPRRKVTLHADADTARLVASWVGVAESLGGIDRVLTAAPGPADAPFLFEGRPCALSNLIDAADPAEEYRRLTDTVARLDKDIAVIESRLNNPGYAAKAPPKLVQETRDALAAKVAERDALRERLARVH